MLIVLFIVGVNSLTACGQNPKAQVTEPESSAVSEKMNVEAKDISENEVSLGRLVSDSEKEPDQKLREERQAENRPGETRSSSETEQAAAKPKKPVIQIAYADPVEIAVPVITPEPVPEFFDTVTEYPDDKEIIEPEQSFADPAPALPETDVHTEEPSVHVEENTTESIEQHSHSYIAVTMAPTCSSGGYTLYSCACGDSFTAEETAELGHDWIEHTERVSAGQEAHEICEDCGMDLTAGGIVGAAIAQHAKQHVLADENATGRTYTSLIDLYSDVSFSRCSRCGETR